MNISYADIFSKCQDLSSFEGRRLKDVNGESLYPIVHITEQDEPLILSLVAQGLASIHASSRYAFDDITYNTNGATVTFVDGNAKNISGDATKVLSECVAMYVMQQWLLDKDETRAKAYELMFTNMLGSFTRLAYRKHAPDLNNY